MTQKPEDDSAGPLSPPPPTEDRWLGLAERIVVDLVVLVLLVRTLMSALEGGSGTEQAFAAGVLAALVLLQRERR